MLDRLPLSVVILAKNEEDNISDCIDSCNFASEVVLVDDESTDNTVAIAESKGSFVKIYHRALAGDYGAQQTFAISKATNTWIFILDADERITPELHEAIERQILSKKKESCWVKRENFCFGQSVRHGVLRPDWVLRLFPTEGVRVKGRVHQSITTPYPATRLTGSLIHHPYKSWDLYFTKFKKYTSLSAKKYQEEGKQCYFFKDIVLRPFWAFFKIYILNCGFLDGKYGFIFSVYHYFYTMTKYVQLYTLQDRASNDKR